MSLYSEHPTVLVAGLETARREVLRQRLREAGFRVIATLTSALQTIHAAWELEPELCIVDASLLARGVPVVRPIKVRLPSTKIVVTLPRLDSDATVDAVADGATACVLEQELLDVTALVAAGVAAGEHEARESQEAGEVVGGAVVGEAEAALVHGSGGVGEAGLLVQVAQLRNFHVLRRQQTRQGCGPFDHGIAPRLTRGGPGPRRLLQRQQPCGYLRLLRE